MIEMAKSDIHQEFCEKLKARRKELGMTQTEVAEILGLTHPSYNRIEKGVTSPTLKTMEKAAQALGVSLRIEFEPESAVTAHH